LVLIALPTVTFLHQPAVVGLEGAAVEEVANPADHIKRYTMKLRLLTASLLLVLGTGAFAQTTTASTVQRDVNQQTRIEDGLKSGSLTTKEAGKLEKEESRIDRQQAADLRDGKLTPQERAKLRREQDRASRDIHASKTNDVKGNPQSASSERMQADVQRNVNQEKRIEQGVQSGSLSKRETARLEAGQARVDHKEAAAAKDGHVGAAEQHNIQRAENHQSDKIFDKKHSGVKVKG
jgi:hypothetical protein